MPQARDFFNNAKQTARQMANHDGGEQNAFNEVEVKLKRMEKEKIGVLEDGTTPYDIASQAWDIVDNKESK